MRRVLLATAVKIFFPVDVPEALAPAVLRDPALDIARRLHGTPAQAFRPEGTPNVNTQQIMASMKKKWDDYVSLNDVGSLCVVSQTTNNDHLKSQEDLEVDLMSAVGVDSDAQLPDGV